MREQQCLRVVIFERVGIHPIPERRSSRDSREQPRSAGLAGKQVDTGRKLRSFAGRRVQKQTGVVFEKVSFGPINRRNKKIVSSHTRLASLLDSLTICLCGLLQHRNDFTMRISGRGKHALQ